MRNPKYDRIRVVDGDTHSSLLVDDKVMVQFKARNVPHNLIVTFVDESIADKFKSPPSWYPCEEAIAHRLIAVLDGERWPNW